MDCALFEVVADAVSEWVADGEVFRPDVDDVFGDWFTGDGVERAGVGAGRPAAGDVPTTAEEQCLSAAHGAEPLDLHLVLAARSRSSFSIQATVTAAT